MIPALPLLFAALLLSACTPDAPPPPRFVPGAPLYQSYTSRGTRILVEDLHQKSHFKLRRRHNHLQVYDHGLRPVGRIFISPDGHLETRLTNGSSGPGIQQISDAIIELDGRWRLEKVGHAGWDLFDPGGDLLALFRLTNLGITLFSSYEQISPQTVRHAPPYLYVIGANDSSQLRLPMQFLPSYTPTPQTDLAILALSIDALPPLDRAILAEWFRTNHTDLLAPNPSLRPIPAPSSAPPPLSDQTI